MPFDRAYEVSPRLEFRIEAHRRGEFHFPPMELPALGVREVYLRSIVCFLAVLVCLALVRSMVNDHLADPPALMNLWTTSTGVDDLPILPSLFDGFVCLPARCRLSSWKWIAKTP